MGDYAWVTLATNDSYSLGALVLAHSLKQVGTKEKLAVLITPGVTNAMRTKLHEVFNIVKEVNLLDSKDEANLRLLKRPELGVTFTKLHCWRLTEFDKCVFLDADTLVLENCDELFDREELSAAPDVGWPDCFNSGVFVYRPSNETHEKLIQFALEKGSFDGGDQGLLNLYFSDWAHKDISKHLPFIYNMSSTACYSYLPAFKQFGGGAKIIHFIGATKPWLQYFDTETRKVYPSEGVKHLQDVLQLWWDIFCTLIHPSLSSEMAGLAGAFAKLTLGTPRTPEQAALDDHLRRQGWEVGNIDYLGRDSFDNIWSKICETLSSAPEPLPKSKEDSPLIPDAKSEEESPAKVEIESTPTPEPDPQAEDLVSVIQPGTQQTDNEKIDTIIQSEIPPQPSEIVAEPPKEIDPPRSQELEKTDLLTEEKAEISKAKEIVTPVEAPSTEVSPKPFETDLSKDILEVESPKLEPQTEEKQTSSPPISTSSESASKVQPSDSSKPESKAAESPKSVVSEVSDSVPQVCKTPETKSQISETRKSAKPVLPESPTAAPTVAESPKSEALTSEGAKLTAVAESPKLSTPVPASPKSEPLTPESSKIATPVPVHPKSEPLTPETSKLATPVPASPKSEPLTPESSKLATPVPVSAKSEPLTSESSKLASPVPVKPISAPLTHESPKVAPQSSKSPKSTTQVTESAKSVPTSKVTLAEVPDTSKSAGVIPGSKIAKAGDVSQLSKPSTPLVSEKPSKPVPVVCPVQPTEKKIAPKDSLKKKGSASKTKATEGTPPTTPVSPEPKIVKQTLNVQAAVPDTPPATSESSAGPTPPPRKSGGTPKKVLPETKK